MNCNKEKIVVFGSFVADLTSRSQGFPTPGQTIFGSNFRMGSGGKGSNQAIAAHKAGADVTMITKVGKDFFADIMLDYYKELGLSTEYILRDPELMTGVALIMVDETTAQNAIVVISGASANVTDEDIQTSLPAFEGASILLLQHEMNQDAQFKIVDIAYERGMKIILNPAPALPVSDDVLRKIDTITPNETEALALTGIEVKTYEDALAAAKLFHEKGVKNVVITMGSLGAFASDGKKAELLPRIPVEAVDTTGAGDAFNGAFATALSEGKDLFTALRFANAAGALSVTKIGTAISTATREEIDAMVKKVYG